MTAYIGKDRKGNEIKLIEEDGIKYPVGVVNEMECGSFRKQLEHVRDLESRDDDVIIVAFFKSGMHWLWEIVSMIQNGTTEYIRYPKEFSMLDFISKEKTDKIPSPRVLNMHFPARWMPKQMLEKRCPIIHIMRNPKDVFVSFYNQYKATPSDYKERDCFSTFLPMVLGENGFYLDVPWFEYVLEWERFTKENPNYPILNLYYEDLKKDLPKAVARIAKFLKKDLSDEIQEIANKTDIEGMRISDSKKEFGDLEVLKQLKSDGQPLMYRKGIVGDWKNWFTVAENERVDAWIEKHLVNTDLKFQYT